MTKSLLFIPDISGFTDFIQNTEIDHSRHIIAELMEILIEANGNEFELAEVEGDALFFYKEGEIPSMEKLLAKAESMFTDFYSHLKLLESHRICPCNACASAPNLNLKIIAHCGKLQYINVQGKRKPFGPEVIQAHRLMKNSVNSDHYLLLSQSLADDMELSEDYHSKLYRFSKAKDKYDGKEVNYIFSPIEPEKLNLRTIAPIKKIHFEKEPTLFFEKEFPVPSEKLLEYITNYNYRQYWIDGVDRFEYNTNEITKIGTEHVCVINEKKVDFVAVTKEVQAGQLVYGELTTSPLPFDELYQFFIITPSGQKSCKLETETYWKAKSLFKKVLIRLMVKQKFEKNIRESIENLYRFVSSNQQQ